MKKDLSGIACNISTGKCNFIINKFVMILVYAYAEKVNLCAIELKYIK